MRTIIFNRILEAVETATEVNRAQILSHSKQSDVVEARSLLFHYLNKAGFYPSQIARTTNQSRQCVNCLLLSFQARCDFSGNMMKRYVKRLDVELSEYILPPE
jgi:glutamate/tyrosine decarboxylase-like PLP-dependent enzyme